MHTAEAARGRGVGAAIVAHLLALARERGYTQVSLETGARPAFAPARRLYRAGASPRAARSATTGQPEQRLHDARALMREQRGGGGRAGPDRAVHVHHTLARDVGRREVQRAERRAERRAEAESPPIANVGE